MAATRSRVETPTRRSARSWNPSIPRSSARRATCRRSWRSCATASASASTRSRRRDGRRSSWTDGATAEEDLDDTDGDLRDASGALRVDAVLERLRMNGVCGATGATLLHVLARGDPEPLEPEDEASPRRSYDKMDLGELKAEVSERNAGPPKRPKRGTQSTPGQLLLVVPDGRVARSSRKPWKSSGGPQEGRRGAQTPQVRGLGVAPSRVVVCRHPAAFSSYVRCMEDNT